MRAPMLVLALAACASPARPRSRIVKDIPLDRDLDLLFVIDNSLSTHDKQALFAQSFPRFVAALDAFPDGRPNLHVGVVTSTVGTGSDAVNSGTCLKTAPDDDGLLVSTPRVLTGCQGPNGRFLIDVDEEGTGARTTNYAGTLAQAFTCIATVGDNGCGFEEPLEAMKRALDGSRPENAGFLRPDADLAVVILTDEDDCSVRDPALFTVPDDQAGPGDLRCAMFAYDCTPPLAPVAGTYTGCTVRTDSYLRAPGFYADFLRAIKDPSQVAVAVIAGDPSSTITLGPLPGSMSQALAVEPSCQTTIDGHLAIGRPGDRLADFASSFGAHGLFRSVCQPDYSQALTDVGGELFTMMSPCLEGPIDARDRDRAAPGLQPACEVSDVFRDVSGTAVPPCRMLDDHTPDPSSPRPCAWFAVDPTCATETDLAVHVERTAAPRTGTVEQISCAAR